MDAYHQELEEETEVARKLQALCADMEANLDLQPAEELRFALVKEEALLATAEERLSTVLAKPNPAKASRRETFLRGAEEITQESVRQAQVLASRAERHLEDAFCRACATAASTKALSSVRVRSRNAWDSEVARLIETLQEVEDISAQLLEHQRDAKEVAVLRHSVWSSAELQIQFSQVATWRWPGMAAAAGAQTQHYMVAPGIILDEKATLALQAASPEIAQQVIAELQTKGPEVRNPSAYVQRALSNARGKVGGFSSGGGGSIQAGEDVTARLDEDARRALQDLSPEASQRILQQLGEAGDKVNNPSAYVMKAVRNHQTEPGLGGGGGLDSGRMNGAVTEVELEEEIRSFSTALDDKARTALKELPASSAVHILRNLRRQAGQVTNASAWVCKAVGNMKRGPPTTSASALALESAKRMRL
ncbi:unnamed protein product [Durusdinium trenchii]|uniref:Uncharacterized protein n=1 Tax=Durusdinium trenchii TaxID=1381693 RepID=A0ABP0LIQ0_9DINO